MSVISAVQRLALRDGLLFKLASTLMVGFCAILACAGDERTCMLATLTVLASLFSWELKGSAASLLGTGVTVVVVRLVTSIELALVVVSLRHWDEESRLLEDAGLVDGDGLAVAPLVAPAAPVLEKKPRMLRCLPVDGACFAVFAVAGVFAGVRAAGDDFDFSTILPGGQSCSVQLI